MNSRDFCLLYVDDDDNDISLVKFAAQSAGISECLRTVTSGAQAIDYIQGHGQFADRRKFPIPSVVLLDLRMPRMNGLDVLRWVRAQPDLVCIVVIAFTASAHPDDVIRACQQGANAFVQKPSSFEELSKFLRLLKSFWGDFHQFPAGSGTLPAELAKPDLSP
jgi:CheY-like chemotaxis protein